MLVFLWRPFSIYLLKVFLDVRGIIAWSWKWANFFGRSFFITAKEQANFFGRLISLDGHFLSLLKNKVISLDDHFLSHRCFFFYSFSGCRVWYSWFLAFVWESLFVYTRLRVFSHLATFGWLTSSFGALSFRLCQRFTSI